MNSTVNTLQNVHNNWIHCDINSQYTSPTASVIERKCLFTENQQMNRICNTQISTMVINSNHFQTLYSSEVHIT
jgi:hypothetical protein